MRDFFTWQDRTPAPIPIEPGHHTDPSLKGQFMVRPQQSTDRCAMRIIVGSRECSSELLERLPGATMFGERAIGAAIVSALHRPGGSVICVAAPAMIDADDQIDYFLRLGTATTRHADQRPPRSRATVLSIDDRSSRWLSEKLMDPSHPDAVAAMAHLRHAVESERRAGREVSLNYVEPSAPLERLAEMLGVVGDQAPAWSIPLGTKSSSRAIFEAQRIPVAAATPVVHDLSTLASTMASLVRIGHRRFVLKLDSTAYASGLGNALLDLGDVHESTADLPGAIEAVIPLAHVIDAKLGWAGFRADIPRSGVLAEEFISGDEFRSPSFQGRLTPDGPQVVSTHEQLLAPNGQTYAGCAFPAAAPYRAQVIEYGFRVGSALYEKGIDRGDYGVDFIAVRNDGRWRVLGCELNLRSTGARHGFDMATTLLGTTPDPDGELKVDGQRRVYISSDSIMSERYVGLRPSALIDAVENSPLHWDPIRKQGVALHLLSPLFEFGKFGATCVATSTDAAEQMLADLRALAVRIGDRAAVPAT
jgi:hypothetical protein